MKKTFILFSLLLVIACSKDDNTEQIDLVGTTWKCTQNPSDWSDTEYTKLKFVSPAVIEFWYKKYEEDHEARDDDWAYILDGNTITVIHPNGSGSGIIEATKMTINVFNFSFVFHKQ